jgi:hypothetical protein
LSQEPFFLPQPGFISRGEWLADALTDPKLPKFAYPGSGMFPIEDSECLAPSSHGILCLKYDICGSSTPRRSSICSKTQKCENTACIHQLENGLKFLHV